MAKKEAGLDWYSNIGKFNFFPTEIYKSNFSLDFSSMTNKLYELKSNSPERIGMNKGGWQSYSKIHNLNEFKDLSLNIIRFVNYTLKNDCIIEEMWGCISSTGDYNTIHNHPSRNPLYTNSKMWSGVYYINPLSDSGCLNIHSPINPSDYAIMRPREGDLFLFDSNTYHSVDSNIKKEDRICIPFNLKLT